MGDVNPIRTLGDYSRPSHEGYRNTIKHPEGNNVVPLRSDTIQLTLLEDLALYDNKSWNTPRDFVKPVKAISLPEDVPSTSDRRLIELENQVQHLMEAVEYMIYLISQSNDKKTRERVEGLNTLERERKNRILDYKMGK
ncbi:hypothetical protein Tco_0970520 [Tanacetum coccineum]